MFTYIEDQKENTVNYYNQQGCWIQNEYSKTNYRSIIGVSLCDLELGHGFIDITSKAQMTEKIDKLDFIKILKFCPT